MKRLITVSLIIAAMVLAGGFLAPVHAQSPANDLKPTFISPTPGLYVNGWPAFTVSYPKEWMEYPHAPSAVLSVGVPRSDIGPGYFLPSMNILFFGNPRPLEDSIKLFMPVWVEYFTDIKVLSDKPSKLKDGTPAWEVETEWVFKNGPKANGLLLATKKDMAWVATLVTADEGKLGEDLTRIAYSLTFQRGREEPVKVPSDVRAFLDMWCADVVSHDVKTIMAHYSDRFRWGGMGKAGMEQWWRNDPASPIQMDTISFEATVTVSEARGDKVYLDGFYSEKTKGDAGGRKRFMYGQQIINEHGQWRWFGNQQ